MVRNEAMADDYHGRRRLLLHPLHSYAANYQDTDETVPIVPMPYSLLSYSNEWLVKNVLTPFRMWIPILLPIQLTIIPLVPILLLLVDVVVVAVAVAVAVAAAVDLKFPFVVLIVVAAVPIVKRRTAAMTTTTAMITLKMLDQCNSVIVVVAAVAVIIVVPLILRTAALATFRR